jgi:hypothetical protein
LKDQQINNLGELKAVIEAAIAEYGEDLPIAWAYRDNSDFTNNPKPCKFRREDLFIGFVNRGYIYASQIEETDNRIFVID